MADVVITKLSTRKTPKKGAVMKVHVRSADGSLHTVRKVDAGTQSFGSDLTYVFGMNVAKARRENKRVTGAADRAVAKG